MTIELCYSSGSDSPVTVGASLTTLATLSLSPTPDVLFLAIHNLSAPGTNLYPYEVIYGGRTCERINVYSTYRDLTPSGYSTYISVYALRTPPSGNQELKARTYSGTLDVWWGAVGFLGAGGFTPPDFPLAAPQAGSNENLSLAADIPPRGAFGSAYGAYYNIEDLRCSETEIHRFDNSRFALGWEPPMGDGKLNWTSGDARQTAIGWSIPAPVILGEIEPAIAGEYSSYASGTGVAGLAVNPGVYFMGVAYAFPDGGECHVTSVTYDGTAMTKVGSTVSQSGCAGWAGNYTVAVEVFAAKDPLWSGSSPAINYSFSSTPQVRAALFLGCSALKIHGDIIDTFTSNSGTVATIGSPAVLTTDKNPISGFLGFAAAFYGGELALSGQNDPAITLYTDDTHAAPGEFMSGDILHLVCCYLRPTKGNSISFGWTDVPGTAKSITATMGIKQELPPRNFRLIASRT